MTAAVLHFVMPGHEIARALPDVGERIGDFLERMGWAKRARCADGKMRWQFGLRLPTICIVNGAAVLQRQWRRRRIKATDSVMFLSRPQGGGGSGSGKQILGLVALVALAAFAIWAGPIVAGMAGLEGLAFGSLTYAQLFTAGIVFGGTMLINTFTAPQAGGLGEDQPAQVYSLSASGNTGRPLQMIPVWYGRIKSFSDWATQAWSEYVGDTQYLNVLLTPTCGKLDLEAITNDDTPLWNKTDGVIGGTGSGGTPPPESGWYSTSQITDPGVGVTGVDMQVATYNPGEEVTLFPADVTTAVEVSGQQLSTTFTGGFIANAAGTKAMKLAIDLLAPSGFYTQDGNKIKNRSVPILVEYRPVDGAGAPTGAYTTLISTTLSYATRQPKRVSLSADVPTTPGRYQVQVKRANAELTENGVDVLNWVGLRAYLQGDSKFADTFTIAIRCKADKVAQGGRRFGIIGTRILPVWDTDPESETYQQWVERPTRNPFWAFYDAAKNTRYGAKIPDARIDFQEVIGEALAADARGDTFDYEFRSDISIPDVFDKILGAARAKHRWIGDTLSVVRDQARSVPQLLLTDREIARGSLSIGMAFNTEDSADCAILDYLDEETWAPASVQYPPNDPPTFIGVKPARFRRDGIVNRAQAFREIAFLWLQSQFRRTTGTLDTEWDGKMLGFGSYIRVQSELPETWGASAVIESRAGVTLQLDRDLPWEETDPPTQHYIEVRNKRGRPFGPLKVSQGDTASQALLDETDLAAVETDQATTLDDALERADGAEDVSVVFGTAENRAQNMLVLTGQPDGDRVTLSLVVDDPRVHATDLGDPPTLPTPPVLRDQPAPLVLGFVAIFRQGVIEPVLDVSWIPAPGALYYTLEVRYDGTENWQPLAQTSDNTWSGMVDYAELDVRIQAVGVRKGAWTERHVAAPTLTFDVSDLDIQVAIENFNAVLRDQLFNQAQTARDKVERAIGRLASAVNDLAAIAQVDATEVKRNLGGATALIRETKALAVDTQSSFASYQIFVEANFDNVHGDVTVVSEALADYLDGASAKFGFLVNADGQISSMIAVAGSGTSAIRFVTSNFQIAILGVDGSEQDIFTLDVVDGVADRAALAGVLFKDGGLTARMVTTGEFITLSAQIKDATIKNAHIGNLEVDTLKIAGNAVTVPYVHKYSNVVRINRLATPLAIFDDYIDVETIAGEVYKVYAIASGSAARNSPNNLFGALRFYWGSTFYPSTQSLYYGLPDVGPGELGYCASDTIEITGDGTTQRIRVRISADAGGTGGTYDFYERVIYMIATKR